MGMVFYFGMEVIGEKSIIKRKTDFWKKELKKI